jgi:thiamine kinase-like enzyme
LQHRALVLSKTKDVKASSKEQEEKFKYFLDHGLFDLKDNKELPNILKSASLFKGGEITEEQLKNMISNSEEIEEDNNSEVVTEKIVPTIKKSKVGRKKSEKFEADADLLVELKDQFPAFWKTPRKFDDFVKSTFIHVYAGSLPTLDSLNKHYSSKGIFFTF